MENLPLDVYVFDTVEYRRALDLQLSLMEKRRKEEIPDTLLLLEHPPVITLGKRGTDGDILLDESKLLEMGVDVVNIERGGQVTYHGPGQIVGYFICNLYEHQRKVKRFVGNIENSIIAFLDSEWGIKAHTDPGNVGVWTDAGGKSEKIAAIGISIKNGITMHGFALNIAPDLSHFGWIVPCGITDKGVTSVEKIRGGSSDRFSKEEIKIQKNRISEVVKDIFGYGCMRIQDGSRLAAAG